MKKSCGILIVVVAFVTICLFFNKQKREASVRKVQATFFKEEKKIYNKSQVKQYLKPILVENIDMSIFSGKDGDEYYVYSKEVGIDSKRSPIDITEVNSLAGNRVYMPKYNIEKIKYCPYYNYYQVDLKDNQVEQVNRYQFDRNKRYRLYSSKNYSVNRTIQEVRPLSIESIKKDQKLLYAAVIYYGFKKVDIQRWKELAASTSGWQIEKTGNGENLVWENKDITDSEKKLAPNYFLMAGDSIIYRSFIIHSGGKEMQNIKKTSMVLAYVNMNHERLKEVYSMKNMIHVNNKIN